MVCGSGGVGKTTTAAALALRAALSGRRVLACTIDPSRRLATSLGLNQISGRPRLLRLGRLAPAAGGSLWAMTLDVKGTFDSLVERYAGDEAAQRRILDNPFYRQLSAALAGSHEYMAMEKLLELEADPRFDLVVLDTPPTRHALDFLEAPDRMLQFLDNSVLRWLIKPYFEAGRLTVKIASRTGALALQMADRVLGMQFLRDLSEFFLAFESMYDGFKERAAHVHALLRAQRLDLPQPLRGARQEGLDHVLVAQAVLPAEDGVGPLQDVVSRVDEDRGARRHPGLPRQAHRALVDDQDVADAQLAGLDGREEPSEAASDHQQIGSQLLLHRGASLSFDQDRFIQR